MLASTPGTSSAITGPGAFLGPNGAPANLSDNWVHPAVPLYTSASHVPDVLPIGPVTGGRAIMTVEKTVAYAVGALMAGMTSAAPISVLGGAALVQSHTVTAAEETIDKDATGSGDSDGAVLSVGGTVYAMDSTTSSAGSGSFAGGLGMAGLGGGLSGSSSAGSGLLASQMLAGGAGAGTGASGASKTLPRWSASLRVTLASGADATSRRELQYSLGRFDKEGDARLACQQVSIRHISNRKQFSCHLMLSPFLVFLSQAIAEVQESQQFCAKRFAKRFGTAYATATAAAAAQAQQQRQQQQQVAYPHLSGAAAAASKGLPPHTASSGAPPSKYMMTTHGAGGAGQFRPGVASSTSSGSMLNPALSAKVASSGEATCGFGSVAKVVVNIAVSGVHGSGSSGNVNALSSQMHRTK